MDSKFVNYKPELFVIPPKLLNKYIEIEKLLRFNVSRGKLVVTNPGLYFQYYLDKMEAIRVERFLGDINLARWTFEQIKDQKINTYVYYDYLKAFVHKYYNLETKQIELSYVEVNKAGPC